MSPENPQDPQKGKAADTSPEDAAEAKQEAARKSAEQPEPQPSEGGTPSAQGSAAEVTGVDKGAADALAAVGDEEPQAAPGDDDPAAGGDGEIADLEGAIVDASAEAPTGDGVEAVAAGGAEVPTDDGVE